MDVFFRLKFKIWKVVKNVFSMVFKKKLQVLAIHIDGQNFECFFLDVKAAQLHEAYACHQNIGKANGVGFYRKSIKNKKQATRQAEPPERWPGVLYERGQE